MAKAKLGLSKNERLLRKHEFDRIFKTGNKLKLNYVYVIYAPNHLNYCRMGISVKKSFGNAVKRNKAKRIIREFFRTSKACLPRGYDFIFIPREGFLEHDREVRKSLSGKLESLVSRN
jgi:ribonuclease P protein component